MHRKRLGFILVGLGLVTVFTAEFTFTPERIAIEKIMKEDINKKVRTEISVREIERTESITFITPKNSGIEIVKFNDPVQEISSGDKIEITGRVGKYRGDLQIVVDEVNVR